MKIIGLEKLDDIISALKQGAVIAFPTETSYGLGCDATNLEAVKRTILTKQRDPDKGLPVLIPKSTSLEKFIISNPAIDQLAEKYWPGALNVIGKIVSSSPIAKPCSKNGYQAVRKSSHPFVIALQEISPIPLVASSANISGDEACYSSEEIIAQFQDQELKPDLVVDGGKIPKVPASTMIKATDNGFEVIRFGSITL
jgi:L-threonylcarbamoyladenylate synthase